jgi:hypothetical protein
LPLSCALVVLLFASDASPADETAQTFVSRLRAVVAGNNRRGAASMFRYPLRVHSPMLPFPMPLDNPPDTLRMYDLLFTPEMRCAIETAQIPVNGRPQPKYPLVVNAGALNLGQGLIVAERTGGVFRITRMTLIGSPAGRKVGMPVVISDIDLRFQGMVRQVAGNLAGDGFDRYTVALTRGSLLQARLERFKGLDAMVRVTDSQGQPVDPKADGKRVWAAPIPASGMYRVDIVRRAPFCDPPLTYLLTLTAR